MKRKSILLVFIFALLANPLLASAAKNPKVKRSKANLALTCKEGTKKNIIIKLKEQRFKSAGISSKSVGASPLQNLGSQYAAAIKSMEPVFKEQSQALT